MIRVSAVLTVALSLGLPITAADAKTPGKTYCFNGTCHTVKTLEETRRLVGITTTVKASFYDDPKNDRFNPSNLTSSGEYFRAWKADNAASPIYPNGTKLLVWHPGNRKALTVRVNNAGPYWGDRKLDLSRAAAEAIGMGGVATLQVRVLEAPSKAEATYSKGRTYATVKGYMGQYASLDAAALGTSAGTTRLASNDASPKKDTPKQSPSQKVASAETPKQQSQPKVASSEAAPKSKSAPVKVATITSPVATPPAEKKAAPIRVASVERPARRNPLADAVGFATERAEREVTASILHRNDQR